MHEPLTRARLGRHVTDQAGIVTEVEPPEQLGRRDEEVAFGQMDAGAYAATGPVAEMVALVRFLRGGVDGGEGGEVGVALGHEVLGAGPSVCVVVEGPDVEDDGGAFREVHSVHVVI